jgi:uncharacterized protein (TIGR02217 family)
MARDSFDDVVFPQTIALGARGGPSRRTDVVSLASGREVRRARWTGSKRRWQVGLGGLTAAEAAALTGFFEARGGRRKSFAFRDPFDHSTAAPGSAPSPTDEVIGTGDGVATEFGLVKTYGTYKRPIHLADLSGLVVAMDGTETSSGWSLAPERDRIVFDTPPASGVLITAGFTFDVAARFESDDLILELGAKGASVPALGLVEVQL